MYIDVVPNRNSPPAVLLREAWREGQKTRKRTVANLSDWPPERIETFRRVLRDGSLVLLAESESAWNQTWHVPTAPDPPTGKQFIELVAKEFGAQPKYRVLTRPMLRVAGWFDTTVRELYEMLYQYEFDYIFDSTKFTTAFRFQPTSYADGVRRTTQAYQQ